MIGNLSRRALLGLLGGGAAVLASGLGFRAFLDDPSTTVQPITSPSDLDDSLRLIGSRHLAARPEERNAAAHTAVADPIAVADDARRVLEGLTDQIRRDFAENRIVDVDGWVLSRTEVSVASLAVLGAGEGR